MPGPEVGENLFGGPSLAALRLLQGFADGGVRVAEIIFIQLTPFVHIQ